MTNEKTLTQHDLSHFCGDGERYQVTWRRNVIYTPGVKHVADAGGAYWLIDAIVSHLGADFISRESEIDARIADLHFWNLSVAEDRTALLQAKADSDCEPFVSQRIPYTDFPLSSVDIWAGFDGTYWTLYLPSEH